MVLYTLYFKSSLPDAYALYFNPQAALHKLSSKAQARLLPFLSKTLDGSQNQAHFP